jgi:hypothetical protein
MVRSSPCHIVGQHTIHRARGTRQCVPHQKRREVVDLWLGVGDV